ncbi:hypothetical protein RQP46_010733 [Phenoliferia psychrophenolica]
MIIQMSDPTVFPESGVTLPGADLTIISSDGIKFKVHKAQLVAHREPFKEKFEDGSTGPEVPLDETAAVLARLLPYAYPDFIPVSAIKFPRDFKFVQAIHKYKVGTPRCDEDARGVDK